MNANASMEVEVEVVRRKKHCSYCNRSFTRAEHLARHERSHRNERPYECSLCDSTFSRQDTFKRHQSRYHSQPRVDSFDESVRGGSGADLPTYAHSQITPEPSRGAPSSTSRDGVESTTTTQPSDFDPMELLLTDSPTLDTSLQGFGFPLIPGAYHFGNPTQTAHENLYAGLPPTYFTPPIEPDGPQTSPLQIVEQLDWKGSFAISEKKYRQLFGEVETIGPPSDFKMSTRFTLERLLDTFAECFLIYVPCIHVPTWKAETAPPCLILSIASIGASYHDDDTTSSWLQRIARASLKNYISLGLHPIADEPLWVLQCILFVMINGCKGASFQNYQEATSLVSLLIDGTRHRKLPSLPDFIEGESNLLQQWYKWIEFQTTLRTCCGIYIFLSALGVTFQTTNGLSNMDMRDCYLPCDEAEWMSGTAKAWLSNRQPGTKPPLRFETAMEILSSPQSEQPLHLSAFASYATLHGIVKQLGSLHQDFWLVDATSLLVQRFEQSLDKWRVCSEQNPEFHLSSRYPSGVLATNAISLYRQAVVRLHSDFGPLRSGLAARNVDTILSNMKSIEIVISNSNTCLRAARCSIEALQMSVQMGLCLTGSISGWHRKLMFNMYSIECCLFLSFWIRGLSNRPASNRSSEENSLVTLTEETLTEVDLDSEIAKKPFWMQLIYAWALVFQYCTASELHGIVADALIKYADSLIE